MIKMYKSAKIKVEAFNKIIQIKENLEEQASQLTGTKITITFSEVINKLIIAYYEQS